MSSNKLSTRKLKMQAPAICHAPPSPPLPIVPPASIKLLCTVQWTVPPAYPDEPTVFTEMFELTKHPLIPGYEGISKDENKRFLVQASFDAEFENCLSQITHRKPDGHWESIFPPNKIVSVNRPLDTGPMCATGSILAGREVAAGGLGCAWVKTYYFRTGNHNGKMAYHSPQTDAWIWWKPTGYWMISKIKGVTTPGFYKLMAGDTPPVNQWYYPLGACAEPVWLIGSNPKYSIASARITQ